MRSQFICPYRIDYTITSTFIYPLTLNTFISYPPTFLSSFIFLFFFYFFYSYYFAIIIIITIITTSSTIITIITTSSITIIIIIIIIFLFTLTTSSFTSITTNNILKMLSIYLNSSPYFPLYSPYLLNLLLNLFL